MKHFVIMDDSSVEAKKLIGLAKKILGVKIISEDELDKMEDAFMIDAIDKGLKSEVAEMEAV